jgi:hypothetical protein
MLCPLLKSECLKNCAWYVIEVEGCIMHVIPSAIMSLNEPNDPDCEHCSDYDNCNINEEDEEGLGPVNLN